MNKEEKDIEVIEDYLNDQLPEAEIAEVEQRLAEDLEFKQLYERIVLLKETAQRAQTRQKIQQIQARKLSEWQSNDTAPSTIKKVNWMRWMAIPLAACLMAVLYFGMADFDTPNMAAMTERGMIGASADVNYLKYQMAHEALQQHDYAKAAMAFSELKEELNLRKYYQDAAKWYEVVATIHIDKAKAKALLAQIDQTNCLYPTSELEWWKMKIRMAF